MTANLVQPGQCAGGLLPPAVGPRNGTEPPGEAGLIIQQEGFEVLYRMRTETEGLKGSHRDSCLEGE